MTFFNLSWTPPPPALLGFALFASLFDSIALICSGHTCDSQRDAFPLNLRSRVFLIDSVKLNRRLRIQDVDDHGYKVTQAHAAAWRLLDRADINNVLILEDDYRIINATAQFFEDPLNLQPVAQFLNGSDWGLFRLGYNPVFIDSSFGCPRECYCHQLAESPFLCEVSLPDRPTTRHCDIRSFVGYAVQKSLREELNAFARASFVNYTMYSGKLFFARQNYSGPQDAIGYISTPQDIYFPGSVEKIHYFAPGFIYQLAKPNAVNAMGYFSSECKTPSPQAKANSLSQLASVAPSERKTQTEPALGQARVRKEGGSQNFLVPDDSSNTL